MFKDLVIDNRSCRRFHQDTPISSETLKELVELARFAPSGGNIQPLKYFLSDTEESNGLIFPHLGWAGYFPDWHGPVEGERPAAYIVILLDKKLKENPGCDHGIAAQTILLGAREKGLGGCIIGNVKRAELQASLELPSRFDILLVLALGVPKETVVIEQLGDFGDIRYYRGPDGVHHVPKRPLEELIVP